MAGTVFIICILVHALAIIKEHVYEYGYEVAMNAEQEQESTSLNKREEIPTSSRSSFVLTDEAKNSRKIVWLMSFPNSGTSFTSRLVRTLSHTATATNYADEVTPKGSHSNSIYPSHDSGPFFYNDHGPFWKNTTSSYLELPDQFVLTKTHCGLGTRCSSCSPDVYIESLSAFAVGCRLGHARVMRDKQKSIERVYVTYLSDRVSKAVHLVRNPMDNIIARFHLDRRTSIRKIDSSNGNANGTNSTRSWANEHPDNSEGFKQWCLDMHQKHLKRETEIFQQQGKHTTTSSNNRIDYIYESLMEVPCHQEFFKYAQWHNMALLTQRSLNLPVMRMHYEDFEHSLEPMGDDLLEFLKLPRIAMTQESDFKPRDYSDYFSGEEKDKIQMLLQRLSSKDTWKLIERYFSP